MTLASTAALVNDQSFRDRVQAAVVSAAIDVKGELPKGGGELYDTKRQALAALVLASPASQVGRFTWAVASNPTISASGTGSTDGDISFTVASVWDDLAGVNYGEAPAP